MDRIEPLVWHIAYDGGGQQWWKAESLLGEICAIWRDGRAEWWLENQCVSGSSSGGIDDAKRDAEAAYQSRVLLVLGGVK
jgi:hypothetical protein